jgi:hypothetical protein
MENNLCCILNKDYWCAKCSKIVCGACAERARNAQTPCDAFPHAFWQISEELKWFSQQTS